MNALPFYLRRRDRRHERPPGESCCILLWLWLVASGVEPVLAQAPHDDQSQKPPTAERIEKAIRGLSDPSYAARTEATRLLCEIGMPAAERLKRAVRDADTETALRAKAILAVFDQIMFAGVSVRLSFSASKTAWNAPVDLTVTMTNESPYPARVPFELGVSARDGDARQVADMLDVAELLRVSRADGPSVDLTVDDISDDRSVVDAVQARLNGGPVSILNPGQQEVLVVRAFNRGWARYRLLDAGTYTARLEYVPAWDDSVLAGKRVGRVASNDASITVTNSAPPGVSRGSTRAALVVERDGEAIVARLTNRTDQPMIVNRNLGPATPFAEAVWVLEHDDTRVDIPVAKGAGLSWRDFREDLLLMVAPGDTLELTRIRAGALFAETKARRRDIDRTWSLYLTYSNLLDRRWQARQGDALTDDPLAPPVLRKVLPRRILSSREISNRIPAPIAD